MDPHFFLKRHQEMARLRTELSASTPGNPVVHGWASYAQTDEDGIIRECLTKIAAVSQMSRTFLEIGCSDGLENNTHQLVLDGYRGVWVDADPSKTTALANALGGLDFVSLRIRNHFVDLHNIHQIQKDTALWLGTDELDFLSVDVDGNDLALVTSALTVTSPKLVCVEYNALFPPPIRIQMSYDPAYVWEGDDYFGASLQAWVDAMPDYSLVGCNLSGVNAFFVRSDLMQGFGRYDPHELYQPARYWLAGQPGGHRRSLKWLRQVLQTK